jgi:hypothetical protein
VYKYGGTAHREVVELRKEHGNNLFTNMASEHILKIAQKYATTKAPICFLRYIRSTSKTIRANRLTVILSTYNPNQRYRGPAMLAKQAAAKGPKLSGGSKFERRY